MIAAARALLSLVLLAGFYLVAVVQVGLICLLAWWLSSYLPGPVVAKIGFPLLVAAGGVSSAALWRALRARREPPAGIPVPVGQAGPLWTVVRETARAAATRPPDEIRIVAEANAAVFENARWLGLRPGQRHLYLGLPVLQAVSSGQLRAILAHELGHYSHAHTRLAAVAYRGRQAITDTVGRINPWNPAGWAFRLYLLIYVIADNAVTRRQELQADAAAAAVAGKAVAIASLTEVSVVGAVFAHFLAGQVRPRAEFGYLPDDLFPGFGRYLAECGPELARLRAEVSTRDDASLWDTHPPLARRIAAINALPGPGSDQPTADDGRAIDLITDWQRIGRRLQPEVAAEAGMHLLPWAAFVAASATAQLQAEADLVFRDAARRQPGMERAGLPEVLAMIGQGEQGLAEKLPQLLGLAAVRSERARWQQSWSGPTYLVDDEGEPLPLLELARLVKRPNGLDRLRRRLDELGIQVGAASMVDGRATARNVRLLGGLGNVRTDTGQADLLLLSNGLVLVETDGDSDAGNKRIRALTAAQPLHEIAAQHLFVPFEEIARAEIGREVPLKARLTLFSGRQLTLNETWTGDKLRRDSAELLVARLRGYQ